MENREFDQILKDKLSEYSPSNQLPDWNRMKSKLDATIEDTAFDQILKDKLVNAEFNLKDASWDSFDHKRKMRRQKRIQILSARLIECVILLLLIWTVNRIVVPEIMEHQHRNNSNQILADKEINSTNQELKQTDQAVSQFYSRSMLLSNKNISKSTLGFQNKNKVSANKFKRLNSNYASKAMSTEVLKSDVKLSNTLSEQPAIIILPNDQSTPINAQELDAKNGETEANTSSDQSLKLNLVPLELSPRLLNFVEPNLIAHKRPLSRTWINVHTSGVINHIKTPQDDLINIPARQQNRIGYELGLSMMADYDRWQLETGISYVKLLSHPNIEETYKNSSFDLIKRTFSKAEFHLIDIPLLIHLNWLEQTKFDISSSFGMSLSFAVKNEFTIVDNKLPRSGGSSLGNIPKPSLIAEKNFNKGSYANIILGSRISYSASYNTKIFADIQCKRMLNSFGFGPNYDRYLQGVITLGAAFRIR